MNGKNDREPSYTGTRGLSQAIVIGAALGTLIGKLTDNMNMGLMLGLVIAVIAWALLYNIRQKLLPKEESVSEKQDGGTEEGKQQDSFIE